MPKLPPFCGTIASLVTMAALLAAPVTGIAQKTPCIHLEGLRTGDPDQDVSNGGLDVYDLLLGSDGVEPSAEAAKTGDPCAMLRWGDDLARRARTQAEWDEALIWYQRAADKGFAPAERELGLLFRDGRGKGHNPVAAVRWLTMAAEQEDTLALLALGDLYDRGDGVAANRDRTLALWQRAASLGDPAAVHLLAGDPGDVPKLRARAAAGDAAAMFELSQRHHWGARGVYPYYPAWEQLLRQAAALDYPPAMFTLGYWMADPAWRKSDVGQGEQLVRRAAEAGDSDAQFWWGKHIYDRNKGAIAHDPDKPSEAADGVHWIIRAAGGGQPGAAAWLDNPVHRWTVALVYARDGVAQAQYDVGHAMLTHEMWGGIPAIAVEYLTRAARQGHARAQYELATVLYGGYDVPRDLPGAARWYQKASDQGMAEATLALGAMTWNGEGVRQDRQRALALVRQAAAAGLDAAWPQLRTLEQNIRVQQQVQAERDAQPGFFESFARALRDTSQRLAAQQRASDAERLKAERRAWDASIMNPANGKYDISQYQYIMKYGSPEPPAPAPPWPSTYQSPPAQWPPVVIREGTAVQM